MNSPFTQHIFPTPLLVGNVEANDICELASTLAYNFRDSTKEARLVSDKWNLGTKSSNTEDYKKYGVTSFCSREDLFHSKDWLPISDFIFKFAEHMISTVAPEDCIKKLKLENMWTTIYPPGAHVPEHTHSNTMLSGVFYVKAPENCGNIVFHDPAWVAKTMHVGIFGEFPCVDTKAFFTPKPGTMILFPAWLPHYTMPNESDSDRIIISFNIHI